MCLGADNRPTSEGLRSFFTMTIGEANSLEERSVIPYSLEEPMNRGEYPLVQGPVSHRGVRMERNQSTPVGLLDKRIRGRGGGHPSSSLQWL